MDTSLCTNRLTLVLQFDQVKFLLICNRKVGLLLCTTSLSLVLVSRSIWLRKDSTLVFSILLLTSLFRSLASFAFSLQCQVCLILVTLCLKVMSDLLWTDLKVQISSNKDFFLPSSNKFREAPSPPSSLPHLLLDFARMFRSDCFSFYLCLLQHAHLTLSIQMSKMSHLFWRTIE